MVGFIITRRFAASPVKKYHPLSSEKRKKKKRKKEKEERARISFMVNGPVKNRTTLTGSSRTRRVALRRSPNGMTILPRGMIDDTVIKNGSAADR